MSLWEAFPNERELTSLFSDHNPKFGFIQVLTPWVFYSVFPVSSVMTLPIKVAVPFFFLNSKQEVQCL